MVHLNGEVPMVTWVYTRVMSLFILPARLLQHEIAKLIIIIVVVIAIVVIVIIMT